MCFLTIDIYLHLLLLHKSGRESRDETDAIVFDTKLLQYIVFPLFEFEVVLPVPCIKCILKVEQESLPKVQWSTVF